MSLHFSRRRFSQMAGVLSVSPWLTGTAWAATGPLEAYAAATSVKQGDSLKFHARDPLGNLKKDKTFAITVVRVAAVDQTLLSTTVKLRNQVVPSDASTAGCQWPESYKLNVPASWPSGLYYAVFGAGSLACYVPFVVSPAKATPGVKILVQIAVTTAQAYNNYGGKSLYSYNSTSGLPATQVSFDRPDSNPNNFAFDAWQGKFVRWLARNGFAADFCTSVDLHRDTTVLNGYQLFLTSGHDEYWSREMRQRLDTFVAGGGNAAIFSGNTCWWQSRFASNSKGVLDRTLVCYKSRTADPDTREAFKTVNWIDLLPPEPENTTIGLSWNHGASWTNAYPRPNTPYVVQQGAHWVYAGTSLSSGGAFGGAYSGYEIDTLDVRKGLDGRAYPRAVDGSPSTLRVLALADASTWDAQAKALGLGGEKSGFGAMSIHSRGGSAGAVFNGGTIDWATALQPELDGLAPTPFSRMTLNIVSRLQNRHLESAEVRQWHNVQTNGDGTRYFFTIGEAGPVGAVLDGGVFNAYAAPLTGTAPVYRFKYPQINGDGERYIYSLNADLGYGWIPDGIAFHAFANWTAGSVAIYQHHAVQTNGDGWRFFYSTKNSEPGWVLDGLSFYAPEV